MDEEHSDCARYLLAKANGNRDTPVLDREMATEGEALIEALRLGVRSYTIQGLAPSQILPAEGRN